MTTQTLWDIYSNDVKRFINSKVKDTALAEDILQEAFIKAHINLSKVKDETKIKSWLFTVVNNQIMDAFRAKSYPDEVIEIALTEDEVEAPHTKEDCLFGIIKQLPKKYRDPLFLADIKGLKQKDVADRLGLGESTTKSLIQRARKLVAKGYMDCCDFKMNEAGYLVGEVKEKENCKVCNSK